jgi:hypothetical protein
MYKAIGMLVASKKKMANPTFEGLFMWLLGEPFLLLSESDFAITDNEYPENIKAIGSIGNTNL